MLLQDTNIPTLVKAQKLKFRDFQKQSLFSKTFRALNFQKNIFQELQGCVKILGVSQAV